VTLAAHDDDALRRAVPALTEEERRRYARHLTLPGAGEAGQLRLKAARVLIVGAGGLGSPTALYLAAAGVGTLGLVDNDVVDASNLQRQILHTTDAVGQPKLESARAQLHALNPNVRVETHAGWLTSANAMEIVGAYDIVIDGTDNFATRYLVNDACVLLDKPNVHGSVFQFEGQASVFATHDGPCYRCLYPEPPPPGLVQNCAEGGVFGVLPGMIGTIQAVETLKLILQTGDLLVGRLLMIDALTMRTRTVQFDRDPECPACGTRTITALIDYEEFCGVSKQADTHATAHPAAPR
jgi:adenylyltransferase/sulfurtransferase